MHTAIPLPVPCKRAPWNKGRLIGQKRPLKPKDVVRSHPSIANPEAIQLDHKRIAFAFPADPGGARQRRWGTKTSPLRHDRAPTPDSVNRSSPRRTAMGETRRERAFPPVPQSGEGSTKARHCQRRRSQIKLPHKRGGSNERISYRPKLRPIGFRRRSRWLSRRATGVSRMGLRNAMRAMWSCALRGYIRDRSRYRNSASSIT
jgi:hypothetical protein